MKVTLELPKDLCSRCKLKNKGEANNFTLCDNCFTKAEQADGISI